MKTLALCALVLCAASPAAAQAPTLDALLREFSELPGLEARFADVWGYVSLPELLRDWPYIERHLGRRRAFWTFLLEGWREDGLLAG